MPPLSTVICGKEVCKNKCWSFWRSNPPIAGMKTVWIKTIQKEKHVDLSKNVIWTTSFKEKTWENHISVYPLVFPTLDKPMRAMSKIYCKIKRDYFSMDKPINHHYAINTPRYLGICSSIMQLPSGYLTVCHGKSPFMGHLFLWAMA